MPDEKSLQQPGDPAEKSSQPTGGPAEATANAEPKEPFHATTEKKQGEQGHKRGWGKGLITGIFIGLAPALIVSYFSAREFQKPDVEVDGVLPIIVHGTRKGNMFPSYELVFIFKVHNDGPSPARIGVGQVAGCALMPSNIAAHIFDQEMEGRNVFEVAEEAEAKWGRARQKIITTGSAPEMYEVEAFSTVYVPIMMSMPIQQNWDASEHLQSTVAVDGNCSDVEVNHDPSAFQLLGMTRSKQRLEPTSLHEDFRNGDLRVEIQIGNELLVAEPSSVKSLKRVDERFWPDVHVDELYENPSSSYLPRDRN